MNTETCKQRIDILRPDTNGGSYRVVSLLPGLDFVFVRSGNESQLSPTVRLFGDPTVEGFAIEEVSGSGSVPQLRATNLSPFDILLIAGQLVKGGKQNRGLNADILVYAGQSAAVPVTCVERGRWSGQSGTRFQHGGFEPASLRQSKMHSVHESRRSSGECRANQSTVWRDIDQLSRACQSHSTSADLLNCYETMDARRAEGQPIVGCTDPALLQELAFLERRILALNRDAQQMLESIQRALDGGLTEQATIGRRSLDLTLRQLGVLQPRYLRRRQRMEQEGTREPTETVTAERIAAANQAAVGASGLLVYFGGQFLTGDIFANAQWFEMLYGDLRNSALISWKLTSTRAPQELNQPRPVTHEMLESSAREILGAAAEGEWVDRPSVAQGRAHLLVHQDYESAVLFDRSDVPLHLLLSSKRVPTIF